MNIHQSRDTSCGHREGKMKKKYGGDGISCFEISFFGEKCNIVVREGITVTPADRERLATLEIGRGFLSVFGTEYKNRKFVFTDLMMTVGDNGKTEMWPRSVCPYDLQDDKAIILQVSPEYPLTRWEKGGVLVVAEDTLMRVRDGKGISLYPPIPPKKSGRRSRYRLKNRGGTLIVKKDDV